MYKYLFYGIVVLFFNINSNYGPILLISFSSKMTALFNLSGFSKEDNCDMLGRDPML